MTTNELYHHGIKGMRWGIRRYQNEDGSLTNAGRKRYDNMDGTKLHRELQRAYDKSKGGMFGKNYGSNVTRVQKEYDDYNNQTHKKLMNNNKEYASLNNKVASIRKDIDKLDAKFLDLMDKYGDSKEGDRISLEIDKKYKEANSYIRKAASIHQKEMAKSGKSEADRYSDTSVAALMDLGFNMDAAKKLTNKMLKEDKYNRAIYL